MTSDPVGNAPRDMGIPGNSHKGRESIEGRVTNDREPVQKVVTGNVRRKKASVWKRLVRGVVADEPTSVGEFLLLEVLLPGIRDVIFDLGSKGLERSLYGDGRRGNVVSSVRGGRSRFATRYDRMADERERPRSLSDRARNTHDFDDLILDSRSEALEIIDGLMHLINQYGQASVRDLLDLAGVTAQPFDAGWGWTSLDSADVRQVRNGFLLILPPTVVLR